MCKSLHLFCALPTAGIARAASSDNQVPLARWMKDTALPDRQESLLFFRLRETSLTQVTHFNVEYLCVQGVIIIQQDISQTCLESRLLKINGFGIVIPNRACKWNLATRLLKKPCVGVRQLPHLLLSGGGLLEARMPDLSRIQSK